MDRCSKRIGKAIRQIQMDTKSKVAKKKKRRPRKKSASCKRKIFAALALIRKYQTQYNTGLYNTGNSVQLPPAPSSIEVFQNREASPSSSSNNGNMFRRGGWRPFHTQNHYNHGREPFWKRRSHLDDVYLPNYEDDSDFENDTCEETFYDNPRPRYNQQYRGYNECNGTRWNNSRDQHRNYRPPYQKNFKNIRKNLNLTNVKCSSESDKKQTTATVVASDTSESSSNKEDKNIKGSSKGQSGHDKEMKTGVLKSETSTKAQESKNSTETVQNNKEISTEVLEPETACKSKTVTQQNLNNKEIKTDVLKSENTIKSKTVKNQNNNVTKTEIHNPETKIVTQSDINNKVTKTELSKPETTIKTTSSTQQQNQTNNLSKTQSQNNIKTGNTAVQQQKKDDHKPQNVIKVLSEHIVKPSTKCQSKEVTIQQKRDDPKPQNAIKFVSENSVKPITKCQPNEVTVPSNNKREKSEPTVNKVLQKTSDKVASNKEKTDTVPETKQKTTVNIDSHITLDEHLICIDSIDTSKSYLKQTAPGSKLVPVPMNTNENQLSVETKKLEESNQNRSKQADELKIDTSKSYLKQIEAPSSNLIPVPMDVDEDQSKKSEESNKNRLKQADEIKMTVCESSSSKQIPVVNGLRSPKNSNNKDIKSSNPSKKGAVNNTFKQCDSVAVPDNNKVKPVETTFKTTKIVGRRIYDSDVEDKSESNNKLPAARKKRSGKSIIVNDSDDDEDSSSKKPKTSYSEINSDELLEQINDVLKEDKNSLSERSNKKTTESASNKKTVEPKKDSRTVPSSSKGEKTKTTVVDENKKIEMDRKVHKIKLNLLPTKVDEPISSPVTPSKSGQTTFIKLGDYKKTVVNKKTAAPEVKMTPLPSPKPASIKHRRGTYSDKSDQTMIILFGSDLKDLDDDEEPDRKKSSKRKSDSDLEKKLPKRKKEDDPTPSTSKSNTDRAKKVERRRSSCLMETTEVSKPKQKLNTRTATMSTLKTAAKDCTTPLKSGQPSNQVGRCCITENYCTNMVEVVIQVELQEISEVIKINKPVNNSESDDVVLVKPNIPLIDLTLDDNQSITPTKKIVQKFEPLIMELDESKLLTDENESNETETPETITLYRSDETMNNNLDIIATSASITPNKNSNTSIVKSRPPSPEVITPPSDSVQKIVEELTNKIQKPSDMPDLNSTDYIEKLTSSSPNEPDNENLEDDDIKIVEEGSTLKPVLQKSSSTTSVIVKSPPANDEQLNVTKPSTNPSPPPYSGTSKKVANNNVPILSYRIGNKKVVSIVTTDPIDQNVQSPRNTPNTVSVTNSTACDIGSSINNFPELINQTSSTKTNVIPNQPNNSVHRTVSNSHENIQTSLSRPANRITAIAPKRPDINVSNTHLSNSTTLLPQSIITNYQPSQLQVTPEPPRNVPLPASIQDNLNKLQQNSQRSSQKSVRNQPSSQVAQVRQSTKPDTVTTLTPSSKTLLSILEAAEIIVPYVLYCHTLKHAVQKFNDVFNKLLTVKKPSFITREFKHQHDDRQKRFWSLAGDFCKEFFHISNCLGSSYQVQPRKLIDSIVYIAQEQGFKDIGFSNAYLYLNRLMEGNKELLCTSDFARSTIDHCKTIIALIETRIEVMKHRNLIQQQIMHYNLICQKQYELSRDVATTSTIHYRRDSNPLIHITGQPVSININSNNLHIGKQYVNQFAVNPNTSVLNQNNKNESPNIQVQSEQAQRDATKRRISNPHIVAMENMVPAFSVQQQPTETEINLRNLLVSDSNNILRNTLLTDHSITQQQPPQNPATIPVRTIETGKSPVPSQAVDSFKIRLPLSVPVGYVKETGTSPSNNILPNMSPQAVEPILRATTPLLHEPEEEQSTTETANAVPTRNGTESNNNTTDKETPEIKQEIKLEKWPFAEDEVIDLTWLDDMDASQVEEDIKFLDIKRENTPPAPEADVVEENQRDLVAPSPADSGISSPPVQPEYSEVIYTDRRCICGKNAEYVCNCMSAMYCSSACQRSHWTIHKSLCQRNKKT